MDYPSGMAEQRLSVSIRMPRALLDALKDAADERSHSMNAEIVQRLDASLQGRLIASVPASEGLDSTEESLVKMWRAMNEDEKQALLLLSERLAAATK